MGDPRKFVIDSFRLLGDFVIEIKFSDGKIQVIDFSNVKHPFSEDFNDLSFFNQVQLNDNFHLEWPSGIDFKPEHLYDWEKYQKYYT